VVDANRGGGRSWGAVLQRRNEVRRLRDARGCLVEELEDHRPYDRDAIRSLKDEVDGDLYVRGSATLVRALLADGLVDELHLFVYPLTRGSGQRLFPAVIMVALEERKTAVSDGGLRLT
jgi:dihydrofolate reductase